MQDTVLVKIVADKYAWVVKRKRLQSLESFRHQVQPSTRSFCHALSGICTTIRTTFILEYKKAAPSNGLIRADFDPVAIVSVYQHYASAVSVLKR